MDLKKSPNCEDSSLTISDGLGHGVVVCGQDAVASPVTAGGGGRDLFVTLTSMLF